VKLRKKSQLLVMVSVIAVTVVFSAISLLTYRLYHLAALEEQGRMAAEMVRLAVTHEMSEGHPEHKNPYIESLVGQTSLKHAQIIPSQQVIEQMGIDISGRDAVRDLDLNVISTGVEAQELIYSDEGIRFHFTIPYVASARGKTNCLNCHDTVEGAVLGAVSLEIDVTSQFYRAIMNTVLVVLLFLLFGLTLAYFLRRLLKPIELTTDELNHVVSRAEKGDFSNRMAKHSNDEIGDIADRTNHFMNTLENSIGSIANDVDTLMSHHKFTERDNLLNTTVSVVNTMAMVSSFKQVIETDRTLEDVYVRFQALLEEQFNFERYSFYELDEATQGLTPVFTSGLPDERALWCSKDILSQCEYCRASRTAHMVSSFGEVKICPSFAGNPAGSDETLYHVCLPVTLSGAVGGVLQLVLNEDNRKSIEADLPVLQAFVNEAAPVIESKRLMKSLKDASMRDPMTGLYNRRFLEEYIDTLISSIHRRKSQVAVVMCDLDHFKQVNDTYGHEVGDDVIKGSSTIMTNTVRSSDIVIRYGGEEFLILLIDSTEEGALMVAERIRTQLEAHPFKVSQGSICKTMSLGVSMFPPDNDDFWECTKYADVALYQAKETGRNQVVRYAEGMNANE